LLLYCWHYQQTKQETGNSKTNLQTNKHRIREDLANSKEFQAEFETALCATVKLERDRLVSGLKL
jgi:hypothetical protein